MNTALRWVAFAGVLLACLAVAYGAYTLAGTAWDAVVNYRSPYTDLDVLETPASQPLAPRVVLVIIDGLRLDAARQMTTLNRLGAYAADVVVTAPQPSLSYPNWTTILSGAPPYVSGVVTNWHEGAAPVDTLLDAADRSGIPFVVVGPSDIATLFPAAARADGSFFKDWSEEYLASTYVDATIKLVAEKDPRLVVLHIPDVDEAGHGSGGSSAEYAATVAKVDSDLRRLVEGVETSNTAFVVVADHGHIDTGGHGGWESDATVLRAILSGKGVSLLQGTGRLEDVAPTVAVLAGIPVPEHSTGRVLASAVATSSAGATMRAAAEQRRQFAELQASTMLGPDVDPATRARVLALTEQDPTAGVAEADSVRQSADRKTRWPYGAAVVGLSLFVIVAVWVASWRAFVAALSGTAAYYLAYNTLFFVVHGNRWSLSSFNSEDLIDSWMNQRMIETVIAGLVAAGVAALVYPMLRDRPKGPRGEYLAGWLTLGPVTVLVAQATLGLQVGWFIWWWGVTPTWRLPDLKWGFKFDLDLVQMTALGLAAVLAPLVTYLVGRYHRRMRGAERTGAWVDPVAADAATRL